MKKSTLLLLFLLLLTSYINAQNYLPMAVENAQWTIYVSDEDNMPPFEEYYYGYRIQGDTIINGLTYKKVYRRYFDTVNPDLGNPLVGPFVVTNETLFGAIRDDIPNKKVYGVIFCPISACGGCDEEFLMYDFELNVNDSYADYCFFADATLYLGEITQENIFNQTRTTQNIYDQGGDTFELRIYEGIGGSSGLFEALAIPFGCPCIGLTNYCVGTDQECLEDFILKTNKNTLNNTIKIYPNPIQDVLTIENPVGISLKKIWIYTVLGKKIKTEISNKIDISKLEKGIYVIKIITNNNYIITKKIIKN